MFSIASKEEARLMDKTTEFIKWLKENTDFDAWHESVRYEVHRKLIEILLRKDE